MEEEPPGSGLAMSCPRGGRRRPDIGPLTLKGRHLRLWTVTHSCSLGVCVFVLLSPEHPLGPAGWEHGYQVEGDPQRKVNLVPRAETECPGGTSRSSSPRTNLQGSGFTLMGDNVSCMKRMLLSSP